MMTYEEKIAEMKSRIKTKLKESPYSGERMIDFSVDSFGGVPLTEFTKEEIIVMFIESVFMKEPTISPDLIIEWEEELGIIV